ncbi:uncharacterized protein LOC122572058 isoform X2 [Bombus pyrosoma]|uniref:uncharacterized protein LOC122572058 isoform X2 n=1 Tax=Bombus pyrosoma TaxID=396416 RepID=UPI001CB8BAC9|nr:uncharacterized protein LOC122572058 isoform X2 [Bombus pyrosoma]XP_043592524.1 uncharacterized protein LOC122572058 isoform X2 [Bombus pyrosoma]
MPQCIVNNCRNSMRSHLVLGKTKKKKKKKRIMSHIIGLEAESVKTEVRICSAHFAEDAFYLIHGTKRPRPGALPSKDSTNSMLAVPDSGTVTKKIKKSNESESSKQDICLLLLYEFGLKQE